MSIPESQLDTWANQGSITQSSDTYQTIKRFLESPSSSYVSKSFEVFLQGSYANDTNIYSESDVDIVIRLDDTFYYDIDALSAEDKAAFQAAHSIPASYTYTQFHEDVLTALKAEYGDAVKAGRKAIRIQADKGRRNADVLVATQFRKYIRYSDSNPNNFIRGICFFTGGLRVANYPKLHSDNCTAKHKSTSSWYKPAVRILKNMRRRMIEHAYLSAGSAPSYFLEGLLYNVPDDKFGQSYQDTITNAINWSYATDRTNFLCANEQYYLLRDVPHVCWPPRDCDSFLNAAIRCWKEWS